MQVINYCTYVFAIQIASHKRKTHTTLHLTLKRIECKRMPETRSCTWAVPPQLRGYYCTLRYLGRFIARNRLAFFSHRMVSFLYVPVLTSRLLVCAKFEYRTKSVEPSAPFYAHLPTLHRLYTSHNECLDRQT